MKRFAGLWALMMVVCLSLYGCNTSANLLLAKDRKALVGTWTWEMSPEELIDAITTGLEEQAEFQARVARHEAHRADHAGHNHEGHDHEGHDHAGHDHEGHDHEGHDHEGHDHEGHDHEGHDHEGHDHEGHDHEGGEALAAPADAESEEEGTPLTEEQQEELILQLRAETFAEINRQLAEAGMEDPDGSLAQQVYDSLEPSFLNGNLRIPAPEGMFPTRTIPNAVIRQTFNADGTYQLNIAGQIFSGSWDMPNQSGSPRRLVVTFEQEGIRQRLIQLVEFKSGSEIVISDEMGVSKVFKRQ